MKKEVTSDQTTSNEDQLREKAGRRRGRGRKKPNLPFFNDMKRE